ncbi:sugar-transfer associated ATP-grasp domain-containing protein [Salinicoccus sp. Marseille-QA3877]
MSNENEEFKELGILTKNKNFKKWSEAGLMDKLDKNLIKDVQNFWKNKTNRKVDPALHIAYMNLTGIKDKRLVTAGVMHYEVLPVFNDYSLTDYYGDKNIYDLLIDSSRSATTVLRNIRGKYFDPDYNIIDPETAESILLNIDSSMIIKPSKSNNGAGIKKLTVQHDKIYIGEEHVTIRQLLKKFKENFIIQEMLEQHPNMAAPHPASVNTIRMLTFRWKNEVKYLLAFARFGSNDDIRDNASVDVSPRVGIKDSGEFFEYGISQNLEIITHHPTTGFEMAKLKPIPNYEEFKQFVKDSHKNLLHVDLVSWDIAVGKDGKPVFIEANFAGSTAFYQLISQKSMFGDITEEVMEHVKKEVQTKKPILEKRYVKKQEKRKEERIKKEEEEKQRLIHNLKADLESVWRDKNEGINKFNKKVDNDEEFQLLRKENEKYKKEYNKLKQSSSWKLTAPLRKISSLIKRK